MGWDILRERAAVYAPRKPLFLLGKGFLGMACCREATHTLVCNPVRKLNKFLGPQSELRSDGVSVCQWDLGKMGRCFRFLLGRNFSSTCCCMLF